MHIAIGYGWFAHAIGYHYERALHDLGHVVTYVGLPSSQRPGYDSATSIRDILDTLSPAPELFLWIDPAAPYFPRDIEVLPIPTACYLVDVHLGTWRSMVARFFDAVFIAQKEYLDTFRQTVGHKQVYWLPLAAAPDVHYKHDLPKIYDVGFIGNMSFAHRHTARRRRLHLLSKQFKTNDFFSSYVPEEVGRVYSQSRIVFNTSISGDVNMRVFEGTACGALMLTDAIGNGLEELFSVGHELVAYRDDAELIEMINYYLAHEDERNQIAEAGYQRTHAEHTYAHRAASILRIVSAPEFQQLAPMRTKGTKERAAARHKIYTHLHMLDIIFDDVRAAGSNPVQRLKAVLPVLMRRLLR